MNSREWWKNRPRWLGGERDAIGLFWRVVIIGGGGAIFVGTLVQYFAEHSRRGH